MKLLITSILLMLVVGCATPLKTISNGKPSPEGYIAAKEFIGRDAEKEFKANKEEEKIRFYGIGIHLTDEATVPGLSQEEVNKYIEKLNFELEVIVDDVNPFAIVSKEFTYSDYWNALKDFISEYNRMVLEMIIKEKHNKAVEATATSAVPHL